MSKVLTELSESARNMHSALMRSLAVTNNGDLADQLGMDASTFSRFVNEKKSNGLSNLESVCAMLHMVDKKLVSSSDVYCSMETADATRELLKNCFNSPDYMRILFK